MTHNELFALLYKKGTLRLSNISQTDFEAVRTAFYRKQSLLSDLGAKEFTLSAKLDAGIASFSFSQPKPATTFVVLEDDSND